MPHDILHLGTRHELSVQEIVDAVSQASGVPELDILSHRQPHWAVRPRMLAMWLAHERTGKSLPAIGRGVGGRHHTTVMHAVNRWPELRGADADLARLERDVTARLERQGDVA